MLTKSWRLRPGLLLAVPTILVSLSGLAHAQQSGLFPLHPIKRERVPCPNEDPVYKLYRYQYFGYHPTVWRRFPEGWGVPSPEAPNPKAEFEKLPVKPAEAIPPEEGEDQDMQAPPERGRQAIPNPPPDTERSPFEMDRPNGGAGAAGTNPPARRAPGAGNAPAPGAEPSPFDIPADDAAQPAPRPRQGQTTKPAVPSLPDPGPAPDLNAPPPGNAPAPRTSRREERDEPDADRGPILAMPDAILPPVEEGSSRDGTARPATAGEVPVASQPAPLPQPGTPTADASQTRRGGRLSSLFGGLGLNWRRR